MKVYETDRKWCNADESRVATGHVRPANRNVLGDHRQGQRDDGQVGTSDTAENKEVADNGRDCHCQKHPNRQAKQAGRLWIYSQLYRCDGHAIGAKAKKCSVAETENACFAPEKIEAERE